MLLFFFFNDTATTEIYTLSLHDALPIFWLVSVEEPEIIFPLFAINVIQDDFKNVEDYEPYGIVKFDKDPANITVNLKSPVYINQNINKGFQKILDREDYQVDYQLFIKQ